MSAGNHSEGDTGPVPTTTPTSIVEPSELPTAAATFPSCDTPSADGQDSLSPDLRDEDPPGPLSGKVRSELAQTTRAREVEAVDYTGYPALAPPQLSQLLGESELTPDETMARSSRVYKLERVPTRRGPAPSCRTLLQVGATWLDTIVDTGASYTVLSREAYQRVAHLCGPMVRAEVGLHGASGATVEVSGFTTMGFKLRGAPFVYDFCVADVQGVDTLLGLDFLMSVGAKLDLENLTLTIGVHEVPVETGSRLYRLSPVPTVAVTDDVEIPAHSRMMVDVTVSSWVGGTALFEPLVSSTHGVTIPSSLYRVQGGGFQLLIDNRGHDPVVLLGMEPLGTLEVPDKVLAREDSLKATGAATGPPPEHSEKPLFCEEGNSLAGRHRCTSTLPEQIGVQGYNPTSGQPLEWSQEPRALTPGQDVGIVTLEMASSVQQDDDDSFRDRTPSRSFVLGSLGDELSDGSTAARTCGEPLEPALPEGSLPSQSCGTLVGNLSPANKLGSHLQEMVPGVDELTPERHGNALELIHTYRSVFMEPEGEVGRTHLVEHGIVTGDADPIRCSYFRKSFQEKAHIEQEVSKMLSNGQVQPSSSPWASPVVLVRKKDGSLRFCVDYRKLNSVTKKDAYPLPRIEDCLDALNGSKWFSTLDLASGYWQVAMKPEDQEKTAFLTHMGLYEFRVMPFGLCNAPATFERLMDNVLGDMKWHKCLVYLDDVVVFGDTFETALANLEEVFRRFQRANLTLKPKKCQLFRQRVEYLGHVISPEGVQPTTEKIDAILHWAAPRKLTEVRSFLGLTGYYRRFIRDYSAIAQPLTRLTKKDVPFEWGPEQEQAFETLRTALVTQPVLGFPTPGGQFVLDTDASLLAIGAVLSQLQDGEERVIAYASSTLSPSQQAYCTTKRELLAVVTFAEHFRPYLAGGRFLIRTDHASLRWLVNFSQTDNMLLRWITRLQQFDFELLHRPGKEHGNADALSRMVRGNCGRVGCPECNPVGDEPPQGALRPVITRAMAKAMTPNRQDEDSHNESSPGGESRRPEVCSDRALTFRRDRGSLPPAELRTDLTHSSTRPSPPEPNDPAGQDDRDSACDSAAATSGESGTSTTVTAGPPRNLVQEPPRGVDVTPDIPVAPTTEPVSPSSQSPPQPGMDSAEGHGESGDAPTSTSETPVDTYSEWFPGYTQEDWRKWQDDDPVLSRLKELIAAHGEAPPEDVKGEAPDVRKYCRQWGFILEVDGILCRRAPTPPSTWLDSNTAEYSLQRLVPRQMRWTLFRAMHEREASHLGYRKVYPLLQARYFWLGMSVDVESWLKSCTMCQRLKPGPGPGRLPLRQEIMSYPMERVAMDLMGPWPTTKKGHKYVLVIQDYFSKWVEAFPLRQHTAPVVARVLVREYFCRYGAPERLHTDQGTEFNSALMRSIYDLWGVSKTRTSPYTPWSDGMVERCNRSLKCLISTHVGDDRNDWDEHLWAVVMAYNATEHKSTGFTPFYLFHSRCEEPRLPTDLVYGRVEVPRIRVCPPTYAENQKYIMAKAFERARRELQRSATTQARGHDSGGLKVRKYQVGDKVWRFYPPHANLKLGKAWTGPWEVVDCQSDWQIKIALPQRPNKPIWVNAACLKPVYERRD